MIGREKKERTLSKIELERVAHHEAGHALMGYLLKSCNPPLKVSIVPRGQSALGFSQPKPDDWSTRPDGGQPRPDGGQPKPDGR